MIEVMVTVPTPEELRHKAEECREDALMVQTPDLRIQLLQIADEYERLAKRAEQFEECAQIGASNDEALKKWFG